MAMACLYVIRDSTSKYECDGHGFYNVFFNVPIHNNISNFQIFAPNDTFRQ